ncbi:sugar ABC transporter substrate-binding protein [Biomaibacter acetigenes]|nr:sugar ABC transporter substrate-binding protein [Biomaibacter acetigenes]
MKKSVASKMLAFLAIFAFVFTLVLTGCSSTESKKETQKEGTAKQEAKADKKQYTIAFSLKTVTNDDFQKAIADSIQKSVEASGNKFLLVTAGEQTAVATQVNQIEDLIMKKVDAIILNPMDSKAVIPALKKAKEANIPVVLVDTPVDKGNEDLYICYIGTDNFNAGVEAGKRMVKELNGQGNVLIVRGANGNAAGDKRVDGFKKGLEGSQIKIVGEEPGDWSNDKAMSVTQNMLQANSDVQGLFSASDVMLDGILQALKDKKKTGLTIMSVDGSKKAVDLIKTGEITGTMAQFPGKMGTMAVDTLLKVLDGSLDPSKVQKTIDSGTMVYDKTNLDEAYKWAF